MLSMSTNQERNQASGGWGFAHFPAFGAGYMLLSPSPDWSIALRALTAILLALVQLQFFTTRTVPPPVAIKLSTELATCSQKFAPN